MLPLMNFLVNVAKRDFTRRYRSETLQAHAEAVGTEPYGRQWFDEFLAKASFTVLVFYRGLW